MTPGGGGGGCGCCCGAEMLLFGICMSVEPFDGCMLFGVGFSIGGLVKCAAFDAVLNRPFIGFKVTDPVLVPLTWLVPFGVDSLSVRPLFIIDSLLFVLNTWVPFWMLVLVVVVV